eukprot:SAG25_NODE_2667_length_1459_cov_1.089706_3_plen_109_part_01
MLGKPRHTLQALCPIRDIALGSPRVQRQQQPPTLRLQPVLWESTGRPPVQLPAGLREHRQGWWQVLLPPLVPPAEPELELELELVGLLPVQGLGAVVLTELSLPSTLEL